MKGKTAHQSMHVLVVCFYHILRIQKRKIKRAKKSELWCFKEVKKSVEKIEKSSKIKRKRKMRLDLLMEKQKKTEFSSNFFVLWGGIYECVLVRATLFFSSVKSTHTFFKQQKRFSVSFRSALFFPSSLSTLVDFSSISIVVPSLTCVLSK